MTNKVTSPFTVFFDRSGEPLDNGYVYIGTAGINPEVSPITVYWDRALTIPAAQPIRTLAGYPSRDGSPGTLIVNPSPCSIVVKDKNGTLVYSNLYAYRNSITDTIDVTWFAGAFGANAEVAFGAASSQALAEDAGTGVVFVPRGVVYDINAIASPIINTGFLQVSPRYKGAVETSWSAAADFYGNATNPSNVWLALEGRVDRGSGSETATQIGLYTGMIVQPTSSTNSYLKSAIFSRARQTDPSDYTGPNIDRDLAAIVGQGYVAAANLTGRAWGGYFEFVVEATGDGLANGIEIDCFNSGTTQTALNTTTSKYGLRVFASSGHTTSAVHIDFNNASGSNEFQHGVSINPSAIATGGYAFLLDGSAAITALGTAAFGTETPRASYALTLDSAGSTKQVIMSDGANESVLVFLDTGTLAASIGFNNTAGRLRIAYAENVNTPLFEFSQAGVLGVGGAVPSAGALTNGLFIANGAAPTVPPSGGVFLYCVSGILKVMNTAGVEFPLNL